MQPSGPWPSLSLVFKRFSGLGLSRAYGIRWIPPNSYLPRYQRGEWVVPQDLVVQIILWPRIDRLFPAHKAPEIITMRFWLRTSVRVGACVRVRARVHICVRTSAWKYTCAYAQAHGSTHVRTYGRMDIRTNRSMDERMGGHMIVRPIRRCTHRAHSTRNTYSALK
jgi:hypothetical protein